MNTSDEPNATGASNPVGNYVVIEDPVHNPDNVAIEKVPEGYRFGRKSEVDSKWHEGSKIWCFSKKWRFHNQGGCFHTKAGTFIVPIGQAFIIPFTSEDEQAQQPHTVAEEFDLPPGSFQESLKRKALEEQLEESQQANRMLRAQVEELKKQLASCQWRPVTQKPTKEDAAPNGDVILAVKYTTCGVAWNHPSWKSPLPHWLGWIPYPHHLLPKQETPEEKNRREFEAYLATLPEPSVHREVWKEDHWNTWQAARAGKAAQS